MWFIHPDVGGNLFLSLDHNSGGSKFVWMPVHQGVPTTVPCRVNDPDANVTLEQSGKPLDFGDNIEYDPKEGMLIPYPNPRFSGSFKCEAVTEDQADSFSVILNYKRK